MKTLLVVLSIWISAGNSLDIHFQAPIPSLFAGLIEWMGKSNYIETDIYKRINGIGDVVTLMRLSGTKKDKTKTGNNELQPTKKKMIDNNKNNMSKKEPIRKNQRRTNAWLRALILPI